MAPSSSTSSSESTLRRALAGWAGALVLLLGYEAFVARSESVWTAVDWSKTGLHERITTEVIPSHEAARVLILGDSCARDAFDPTQIESELGWTRGTVANLAVTGGTMYDASLLYAEARKQMSELQVVVLCVEDHHLGPRSVTDIERRYATTGERLSDWRGEDRSALLVGQVWQTLATRRAVRLRLREMQRGRDRRTPLGPDGRVVWRSPDEELEFGPEGHDPTARLAQLYGPMRQNGEPLCALGQRPLHSLLDRLEADGVETWVLRLPRRPSFEQASIERYPEVWHAVRDGFLALRERHPEAYVADAAAKPWVAEGRLGPRQFYDWGHTTGSGTRVLSTLLSRRLRAFEAARYGSLRTELIAPSPPR